MDESSKTHEKIDFFDPNEDRMVYSMCLILAFTQHQLMKRIYPGTHLDEEICKCTMANLVRVLKGRVQNLDGVPIESH